MTEPTDPTVIGQLCALAERTGGLVLPPSRSHSVSRALNMACRRTGIPPAGLAAHLSASTTAPAELAAFLADLTIGESFLFRTSTQITALTEHLAARGWPPHLRVWSAGCSTGEEAVSLAAAISDAATPTAAATFEIYATDLSNASLDVARAGSYGPRSVRSGTPFRHARWFIKDGEHLRVRPALLKRIAYDQLNLADRVALHGVTGPFDAVFCRNVLMYLTPQVAAAAVDRFADVLRPGGWLFVAPTELSLLEFDRFDLTSTSGVLAYRVRVTASRGPANVVGLVVSAPAATANLLPNQPGNPVVATPASSVPDETSSGQRDVHDALLALERNDLAAALDAARRAVYRDPTQPMHHLVLGTVLARLGHLRRARASAASAHELLTSAAARSADHLAASASLDALERLVARSTR